MKKPAAGVDPAPETPITPQAQQDAPARALASIQHPAEGGSYVRDPETGKLTKQKD